jgi:hypothetical protein
VSDPKDEAPKPDWIDPADPDIPKFGWRALNGGAQIASRGERVIGIAYTAESRYGDSGQYLAYEFWWFPIDDVSREEVLFALSPGVKEWDSRWDATHRACEWIEAQHAAWRSAHG